MHTPRFHLAPPPRKINGGDAVAIDIQKINARLLFDCDRQSAHVEADIQFVMGPNAGWPVLDLRQKIERAWLNDKEIPPETMAHHDLGGGPDAEMRVIRHRLPAGSDNRLQLSYALKSPQASGARPIQWRDKRLSFDFAFSNLSAGHFLEMWFPANLIFDQFAFSLEIQIFNGRTDHVAITNGALSWLGPNHWHIAFPDYFTACCPMLVIEASERLERRTGMVQPFGNEEPIVLEVYRMRSVEANLASIETKIAAELRANRQAIGPYLHGQRFTALVWNEHRSMEYPGGTTCHLESLEHEILHSWFARGVMPARQRDAWMFEAWTTFATGVEGLQSEIDATLSRPKLLAPAADYNRIIPEAAYTQGSAFFAALGDEMGLELLAQAMHAFYQAYQGQAVDNAMLLAHLLVAGKKRTIADLFAHYVYSADRAANNGCSDLKIESLGLQIAENGRRENPAAGGRQRRRLTAVIRNTGDTAADHFVVFFSRKYSPGIPEYPLDFHPRMFAAGVGYDLAPGAATRVQAHFFGRSGPGPKKTFAGNLLAEVYTPWDHVPDGVRHVGGAKGKLKQHKSKRIELHPEQEADLLIDLGRYRQQQPELARLEIIREPQWGHLSVSLHHPDNDYLRHFVHRVAIPHTSVLENADRSQTGKEDPSIWSDRLIEDLDDSFLRTDAFWITRQQRTHLAFRPGTHAGLPLLIQPKDRILFNLKVQAPKNACPGDRITVKALQRNDQGRMMNELDITLCVVGASA